MIGGGPMRSVRTGYRVLRALGAGGTADVYAVEPPSGGTPVALKRMHGISPDALLRLKREFRAVEHLSHPNLVRLHELGEDADGLYFTMELVDGVDLRSYCLREEDRGEGRLHRLAEALPQLLDALAYLHASGVVHGDLSPRNVLVRGDGVVKLLDFGLHALTGESIASRASAAGTPGYLAPERVRGEPPTPAADLYSLGCIVFEIVAGRRPFEGSVRELLDAHLEAEAPDLASIVPEVPAVLAQACAGLLAKQPEQRPSLGVARAELLAGLGAGEVSRREPPVVAPLVGREELQTRLRAALDAIDRGEGLVLVLHGPSGIGKTALAGWLGGVAERDGYAALAGRARPCEKLPFNAMDGVIDAVALRLGAAAGSEHARSAAAIAAATFPVLADAGGRDLSRDRVRASVRERLFGPSPAERAPGRRAVFDAVATLIGEAAGARGTVIVVDDAQWADADAIALLDHVLDAGAGRIGTILVVRDDLGPDVGPAARWLAARSDVVRVEVPPLGDEAMALIVREHADGTDDDTIARTARACGGLPILAVIASRHVDAPDPLAAAVQDLAGQANAISREVLALLALADGPLSIDELAELVRIAVRDARAAVDELARRSLVRATPSGGVQLFHDSVRSRVENAMASDWIALAHERLAEQLARRGAAAEHVRHLLRAGRVAEASRIARAAAEAATRRHAHAQAADLYAIALQHPEGNRAELRRARAEALEGCARYAEAAECWQQLATLGPRDVTITLREANARLGSRQLGAGLELLERSLGALGVPRVRRSPLSSLRAGLRFLRGPTRAARPARSDPASVARTHQLLRIGQLLGYFDTLVGIRVLQHAHDEFARAGEREGVAWCNYLFSLLSRFSDVERRAGLSDRYRAAAEAQLRGMQPTSPVLRAFPAFLDGYTHLRAGRWREAIDELDRALAITSDTGLVGRFEHQLALSMRTSAVLMTQDARAAEAAVARFASTVADSSDSAMQCHVINARTVVLVLQGHADRAAALAGTLAREWPDEPATVQRVLAAAYAAYPELYRQRAVECRRALARPLAEARRMRLFRTAYGPILATWAALAEALALRHGDRTASRRCVERWASIAGGRPTLQTTGAVRARAYAADAAGEHERAVELLAHAERDAERWEQPVDAAIAAYQRGRRIGGTEGAEAMWRARSRLAELGVSARLLDEDSAPVGSRA